jgi:hypothetical protein
MEIKVRAIDGGEPKGVQEVEKELLEKHEQEVGSAEPPASNSIPKIDLSQPEPPKAQEPEPEISQTETPKEIDLTEEQVLSYIGKRYNKQINSFDELVSERQQAEDMPEDVAAYMKYRKETGRGFEDFLKLNKDYESMDQDEILKEYLSITQQGLDSEDIDVLMDDYRYDEDIDDESKVKKVKIAKKKAVAEAKKFFNEHKEKYKIPLESRSGFIPDAEREEFEAYKQYISSAKTLQEENERKRGWFEQKTDEVFSNEFKGFEFKINDRSLKFSPADAAELRKAQTTPMNFINKFLDDTGMIKDAAGYHKSLAVAMHPDRFAKFFYEQGIADATEDVMRKTKNINMSERRAPEVVGKGGVQIKAVNPDSGKGLKIRSIKKV